VSALRKLPLSGILGIAFGVLGNMFVIAFWTWVVLSTHPYADARYLIEVVVPGLVVLLTFVFLFPLGFLAMLEPGKRNIRPDYHTAVAHPVSGWLRRTTHAQQLAPYHFDTMKHLTNRWSQPLAS